MAEYIEREALLELINEDCKYKNPTNEYTRGCNEVCDWAIKTIKNIPAADVVPKSEVEMLKEANAGLSLALLYECEPTKELLSELEKAVRVTVAREIFEEIEKIATADGAYDYVSIQEIAELKKKYTEGDK